MEEYFDEFESRFADELENFAELDSQDSVPLDQPPNRFARSAEEDIFGDGGLTYPDEDDDPVPPPRKRPTSGDGDSAPDKRRRVDNELVIDETSDVVAAVNADVPRIGKGQRNGTTGASTLLESKSLSLSSFLKNKGRPHSNGDFGNGIDEDVVPEGADPSVSIDRDAERKRVFKRPPPEDDYVFVTGSEGGRRVYVSVRPDEELDSSSSAPEHEWQRIERESRVFLASKRRNLLTEDFAALKRRVVLEMESAKGVELADEQEFFESEDEEEGIDPDAVIDRHRLWVEKYAPRGYTDLLSDDGVNRTFLRWLKMWDKLVFGKEVKLTKDKKHLAPVGEARVSASNDNFVSKFGKRDKGRDGWKNDKFGKNPSGDDKFTGKRDGDETSEAGQARPFKFKNEKNSKFPPGSKFKDPGQLTEEFDKLGRPEQKVVLLSGPPGLGKTTLAHVVARHAGYAVQEMNASDDRNAEAFKNKIEAACQTKSVLGEDSRPVCLVVDEIDGAAAPAVNVLVNFLKIGSGGAASAADPSTGTGKKKNKPKPLLRPVVCICNDLYAPSIRALRQMALVLRVPATDSQRLIHRLLHVSRAERLKADQATIRLLCRKMENDVRGCLNTLQFVRGRYKELTQAMVNSSAVGEKDVHRSLYSVWQSVFQMPKTEKRPFALDQCPRGPSTRTPARTSRFDSALSLVESVGESEKIVQGLFENYLFAKIKDSRMVALNLAESWLQLYDAMSTKILSTQNYIMMPYLHFAPVSFHLLFATNNPAKVKYPNTEFENYTKSTQNAQLIKSALDEVQLKIRKWLTPPLLLEDVLPPLMEIIQPGLRPVNAQLYSAKEKAQIAQLIDNMMSFGLTYQQEKTDEGQYHYVLEPKIDRLSRFAVSATSGSSDGSRPTAPRQLTYAAKQMLARELELARMRRSEAAVAAKTLKASPKKRNPFASPTKKETTEAAKPSTLNRLFGPANLGAKENKPKENNAEKSHPAASAKPAPKTPKISVVKDFFGRVIKSPTGDDKIGVASAKMEKKRNYSGDALWFCFKEGYSNAVRKPVKFRDLL